MQDEEAIRAYVEAVRRLLDHGGYERTGDARESRRWGRDHVARVLDRLGRPDARHTVHVAGSKGKGSIAAIADSILRAAGAHCMLMTSPDLHQARERIAIDGAPLDYARFAALATRLLDQEGTEGWSYFELMTVLGWLAAEDAGCDWQVVEVGLGGRLDTTNTMTSKEVAVIAPIDLEHTAILGDTIPQIAAEKAGIIIGPCEVVTSPMRASALEVIAARANEMGATLHAVPDECALHVASQSLEGQTFDLRTPVRTYRGLKLGLIGRHQTENAATAVRAAELAGAESGNGLYAIESLASGNGPVATVRARFREPSTGVYRELSWIVPYTGSAPRLGDAAPRMRLAVAAASFGEWLSQSPFATEAPPARLLPLLSGVPETFARPFERADHTIQADITHASFLSSQWLPRIAQAGGCQYMKPMPSPVPAGVR